MEKVFKNGNSARGDNRDILIKIKDGYIEFFFNDQYLRQAKWVEEETERRKEVNEPELTEDEAGNHNFYWFDAADWHKSKSENLDRGDNWHKHMERKSWFTNEMETFLDLNTH